MEFEINNTGKKTQESSDIGFLQRRRLVGTWGTEVEGRHYTTHPVQILGEI